MCDAWPHVFLSSCWPHVQLRNAFVLLHQLDIHTPWCIHQSRIANHAANKVSLQWQKPFWTVSGSWRLHMSNGGIGPGLGFQNTSCSLRQCKVCVAFSFSQWVICPCHYMAISVVQFSSYLLSLGRFTYLLVCPFIFEIFHFFKARPLAR